METYLIYVIEDLVVTAVLGGVVYAYARSRWDAFGMRVVAIAAIAGAVLSAVMAYMKQYTALIATGDWNLGIFIVSLVVFLLVLGCLIAVTVVGRKAKALPAEEAEGAGIASRETGTMRVLHLIVLFGLAFILLLRIFYSLPDVINYPANFGISTENLISSDFAYRIIGWLIGIFVVGLVCVAVSKALKALDARSIGIATAVIVGIIVFVQSMSLFQILLARRIIVRGTVLYSIMFPLTSWVSNHTAVFTLGIIIVTILLAAFVIMLSLRDDEPYANPAEHRRNKARWRNKRRWSICLIVCLLFSFCIITVVKDYVNRGPEIVESEECDIRDDGMYISLEQVDDGHLHRFTFETTPGFTTSSGYETQGGTGVRVIVIKKPNSNAYGVGLDACDICGTTGYYERDGQVVCSKCDVVMNINTIGFKGGCNPIVIDYKIADGYIFIPSEALLEYEKIPGSSWE